MPKGEDVIRRQLETLLADYADFNSTTVSVQALPTALQFAKQVSKGYPGVYRAYSKSQNKTGQIQTWVDPNMIESAAFNWTKYDLQQLVDEKIEVAVTPNGRADDLHIIDSQHEPVFLSPGAVDMTINEFLEKLNTANNGEVDQGSSSSVHYLQSQNSNLTTTALRPVLKHVPSNFPFAEGVLPEPEAINIWIGDERSVTSTHRDPYENLYLVLKGSKTFTLFPPVDEIVLPTQFVRTGRYVLDEQTGIFSTVLDEAESDGDDPPRIPWIAVDPLGSREKIIARYPMYASASPRTVTVEEGEILYLPSGWYHHVQQQCGEWDEDGSRAPCIAVNYWYDMEYEGEKYIMRQLVGRLAALLKAEIDENP